MAFFSRLLQGLLRCRIAVQPRDTLEQRTNASRQGCGVCMDFSCGRSRHLPARGERNQAGVVHKPTWSTTKVAQLRYSGPSFDWIGTTFAGSCFTCLAVA